MAIPIADLPTVLAQSAAEATATTSRSLEFDWPQSGREWLLFAGFAFALVFIVWMYVRDTRQLSRGWTVWLALLRIGVVAGLVVIALNPQERTQKDAFRPSEVAILVDTSTSMQQPAGDPEETGDAERETRMAAVRELLTGSPLIAELQKSHNVDLYTFDSALSENRHRFETDYDPRRKTDEGETPFAATGKEATPPPDWNAILQACVWWRSGSAGPSRRSMCRSRGWSPRPTCSCRGPTRRRTGRTRSRSPATCSRRGWPGATCGSN
jgi:hypothetical protein